MYTSCLGVLPLSQWPGTAWSISLSPANRPGSGAVLWAEGAASRPWSHCQPVLLMAFPVAASTPTCGPWAAAAAASRRCLRAAGCPTGWARSSCGALRDISPPCPTRCRPPPPPPRPCTTEPRPPSCPTATTTPLHMPGWHPPGHLSPPLPCKPRPLALRHF